MRVGNNAPILQVKLNMDDLKEIVQIGMYTVRAPSASGRLVLDDGPPH